MGPENNSSKNTGPGKPDKNLENKASNTDDRFQIKMNFGEQDEEDSVVDGVEAQRKVELSDKAKAKKRGDKSTWLEEEPEAKKSVEAEIKEREEAQARNRAEEEKIQKDNAEVKRIIQEEQSRKEAAEAKRKTQEENKVKKAAAAIKLRDEEWRKFKEEADARANSGSVNRLEYTRETNESSEKTPPIKNRDRKRKVLVTLLIAALAITVLWIFSVFNEGTERQTPVVPKNEATEIEDVSVTPEPEPEPDAANQEVPFSNLGIGDAFEGGIVFIVDPSSKTGKVAYSKDVGPMPWKNAMNIHGQLGEGWRLPTMDELGEMYRNIGQGANNSGQFSDDLYWSATPYDTYQARLLRFSDGNTSFHYNNSVSDRKFLVRAVRDFSR
ncbi:hypothetical protein [Pricia sp.]|uniref:hypothetical protein n=1 Tax=Pricia sp. TaxID=2268138 RepID=UPI003593F8F6